MQANYKILLLAAACAAALVTQTPAASQSIQYTYDPLGRMVSASYPNAALTNYTYDAGGNRTRVQNAGNSLPSGGPVAQDDVVNLPPGASQTILALANDIGTGLSIISLDNAVGPWSVDDDIKVIFFGAAPGTYGTDYTIVDSVGRTSTARVTAYVQ